MKHTYKNILLFIVAIILSTILYPIGFLYAIVKGGDRYHYLFKVSYSIDQTGNVLCGKLFNRTLLKKDTVVSFGNPDETISSVIGRAKLAQELSYTGRAVDTFLNILDNNHSIKSIEQSENDYHNK